MQFFNSRHATFARRCATSLVAACLAQAAFAGDDTGQANKHLKGQYAYSGEASCLYSPSGFNTTTLTPLGSSFVSSFSVIGLWTWHGDGTSSLTGRIVSFNQDPLNSSASFTPAASTVDITANFKSVVGNDGKTFTEEVIPGSLRGKYLNGARVGQFFTIDKATLAGYILNNRTALAMATPGTEIETVTIYDASGKNVLATLPRICHGSRTLTRLTQN